MTLRLAPLVCQLPIVDKDGEIVRLQPKFAQRRWLEVADRQLNTTGKVRTITLKARQVGFSTVTAAYGHTLLMVKPNSAGLTMAHENDASEHLLSMHSLFYDEGPYRELYSVKHKASNHLSWVENRSSMRIATAGNKRAGRSKTLRVVHASEFGLWEAPTITWGGLRQAVPSRPFTMIAIESTAFGVGNLFHEMWRRAEAGDSEYEPIFVPWWHDPGYRASVAGISGRIGKRTDEERALQKAYGVDDDQLLWYRYCLQDLCGGDEGLRDQEYPSDATAAFVATGNNVFAEERLRAHYQPLARFAQGRLERDGDRVTFVPDARGPLKIFRRPADKDHGVYQIGADPARVAGRGDYACAQVINRRTLEQVAVFRQRIDAEDFTHEVFKLGLLFNLATVAPEVEGPGALVVGGLRALRYPNVWRTKKFTQMQGKALSFGWHTTDDTKRAALERTRSYVNNPLAHGIGLVIHDPTTFDEMRNYVQLPNGKFGNANGSPHDDTVMALAIACTTHYLDPLPPPLGTRMPFDLDEEPDRGDTI